MLFSDAQAIPYSASGMSLTSSHGNDQKLLKPLSYLFIARGAALDPHRPLAPDQPRAGDALNRLPVRAAQCVP